MLDLVDTHCHINDPAFAEDRSEVISRARELGVSSFIIPGMDLETSQKALQIYSQFSFCRPAIGVHPNAALDWNDEIKDKLRNFARQPGVVAIGETGLDYFHESIKQEDQQRRLAFQLDLALQMDLPVILHNRNSTSDLLVILHDWVNAIPNDKSIKKHPGIFHAYSGDIDILNFSKTHGFMFGIGGTFTFPKNLTHIRTLKQYLNHIVLETDSPVLSPQGKRGTRNEPANILIILDILSQQLEMEKSVLANLTSDNARKVFRLQ